MELMNIENNEKLCWICWISTTEDEKAQWVKPCKCRGTVKWVHQNCLQRWVFEKHGINVPVDVKCTRCEIQYRIKYPPVPILVKIVEKLAGILDDSLIQLVLIETVFITNTVVIRTPLSVDGFLRVKSREPILKFLSRALFDLPGMFHRTRNLECPPLVLLQIEPIVEGSSVELSIGSLSYLTIFLCPLLFKLEDKIALKVAEQFANKDNNQNQLLQQIVISDSKTNAVRISFTALCLPIMSKLVGMCSLFKSYIISPVRRSFLGFFLLLTISTSFGIYFKYQKLLYSRQNRVILDYRDEDMDHEIDE